MYQRIMVAVDGSATAERGLVDAYLLEYCNEGDVDAEAQRVVGLLGGYARSALSPTDRRSVEAHLAVDPRDRDGERPAAGMRRHTSADSRRLLGVASSLPQLLPPAIAPGITGLSIEQHRAALGTSERALGSAARRADPSSRVRIAVVIGSLIAAVLAVIGVAYLVRQPSDGGHGAVPSVPMPSVPMPSVPVPSGAMPSGAMPSGAMPNGPGLHAGAYALGIDSPNATLALDASSSDVGLRSRVLGSTVGPDA